MKSRKFEFVPWKKVIVHEIIFEPVEKITSYFKALIPMGGVGEPIRWCDGWLFSIAGEPLAPHVSNDKKKGILHWSTLSLSPCPQSTSKIEIPEGRIVVPVIDVSHSPFFKDMIRWVTSTFPEEVEKVLSWTKSHH